MLACKCPTFKSNYLLNSCHQKENRSMTEKKPIYPVQRGKENCWWGKVGCFFFCFFLGWNSDLIIQLLICCVLVEKGDLGITAGMMHLTLICSPMPKRQYLVCFIFCLTHVQSELLAKTCNHVTWFVGAAEAINYITLLKKKL